MNEQLLSHYHKLIDMVKIWLQYVLLNYDRTLRMEHKCPSFEDLCQQNCVSSPLMFCDYALETHYFVNGMVWLKFV